MSEKTEFDLTIVHDLCKNATPGPWIAIPDCPRDYPDGAWSILPASNVEQLPICTVDHADDIDDPTRKHAEIDAKFIAESRSVVPHLLEAYERSMEISFAYHGERDQLANDLESAKKTEADLLRENAALKASYARVRELLGEAVKAVMWVYGPSHPLALKISEILAETPAASLAAIQDAVKAEEREACEGLVYTTRCESGLSIRTEIALAIRNRGNGGEAK